MARRRKKRGLGALGASSVTHDKRLRMAADSAIRASGSAIKYTQLGSLNCSMAVRFVGDAERQAGRAEAHLHAIARGRMKREDYDLVDRADAAVSKAIGTMIEVCVVKRRS